MTKARTKTTEKLDLYQLVTDRIISILEKGVTPWKKPWGDYGPAKNYATGRRYTGINQLLLSLAQHEVPYYMTFNQVTEKKGKVRKGAKSEQVFFFKMLVKNERGTFDASQVQVGENDTLIPVLRYFNVFNVADIEGIDFRIEKLPVKKDNERIEAADKVVSGYKNAPAIRHENKGRAYYSRIGDLVNVPPISNFVSADMYYSVLFHELVHSTGTENRTNRFVRTGNTQTQFGSKEYSIEELTAEMGAAYLNEYCGLNVDQTHEDSASYIENWLRQLRNDKRFIFKAAAESQKAVDYILGLNSKED